MDFISEELERYAAFHSQKEPELLKELSKATFQKILQPRMLSGHLQGRFLSLISKLVQPKSILEIGTYTGYSALCLAEGLKTDGVLHTIDCNEELVDFQKHYFDKSEYKNHIKQYLGDAKHIIPTIGETFDLVFIDADKSNYPTYFELVIERLHSGGIIISDNVLWSAKVLSDAAPNDEDTKSLQLYNAMINNDPRVEVVLLPIRDGLSICRKK
jgi:caffeoyl-CoA O-methyltransferase